MILAFSCIVFWATQFEKKLYRCDIDDCFKKNEASFIILMINICFLNKMRVQFIKSAWIRFSEGEFD